MSEQMRFCPYCGKKLDEQETAFCPYCGKAMGGEETPAPKAVPRPSEPAPAPEPPKPAPAPAPVIEEKTPCRAAAPRPAVTAPIRGGRKRSMGGWILSVAAWALSFAVVYIAGEELDMLDEPGILFPLLFLGSFPLWFPFFHPKRREKGKGVWLRWALIMAAAVIAVIFFAEEIL